MPLVITPATPDDVAAIVPLRNAVARDHTQKYGVGHWSSEATEKSILRGLSAPPHTFRELVARDGEVIVATLQLVTKKPWAIDPAYFTPVKQALYLIGMAVHPDHQRRGLGRRMIQEAITTAKAWPADAIRLDAYDSTGGAGAFYAKCGFREVGRVVYRKTPLIYFETVF